MCAGVHSICQWSPSLIRIQSIAQYGPQIESMEKMGLDVANTEEKLVPVNLETRFFELSAAAFRVQGQVNVVSRQTNIAYLNDPTNILVKATGLQASTRGIANFFLTTSLPQFIKVLTDMDSSTNIANAFYSTIGASSAPISEAKPIAEAVVERLESDLSALKKLSSRIDEAISVGKTQADAFAGEMDNVTAQIDGKDGQLAKAGAVIDTVQAAINDDLDNIVTSARVIGDGVKNLFTYAMSIFTSPQQVSDKDKEKKSDPKSDTTDDKPDEPKADPFGEVEPFDVESINSVEDGVSQSVAVMQSLRKNNKKLEELLQAKAALSAALTACQALRLQSQTMNGTLEAFSESIAAFMTAYEQMVNNYRDLANTLNETTEEGSAELLVQLKAASLSWVSIAETNTEIQAAFSGIRPLFPQVT
jgi:hypothetical protein